MTRKKLLMLIGSVCLALVLVVPVIAGCAAPTPTPTPTPTPADLLDEPLEVFSFSVGTGGLGGTYYPYAAGWTELVNKNIPGLTATVEVTGGSIANVRLIHSKEAMLGEAQVDVAVEAYSGIGRFEGERLDSLRGLFFMYPEYVHLVTLAKTPIYTIADIVGKRFSTGSPGSGVEFTVHYLMEALGYTDDDFKISRLGLSESTAALKDGTIDVAAMGPGGIPLSAVIDISTTHDIRFIPITPEDVDKVNALYPYFSAGNIKAGSYRGVDEDVSSLFIGSMVLAHKDIQYRAAYEIVKIVMENLDYMRTVHAAANNTTLENGPNVGIPLHPGAERYYRDMGVLK